MTTLKDSLSQPSNEQLKKALADAKTDKTKLLFLTELRNKRTTWCFSEELSIRKEIDKFLEEYVDVN